MKTKRLFFGLEVEAPWPLHYPRGRILAEEDRHITLAFLGETDWEELEKKLDLIPGLPFAVGPAGIATKLLFLPERTPRVVSLDVHWLTQENALLRFQKTLADFLKIEDKRPFLSHLTVARAPFHPQEWEKAFEMLPVIVKGFHLYESIGNLRYPSLWSKALLPAFEEFEHTADIAFHIRGQTLEELYLHAAVALGFKYPPLLAYLKPHTFADLSDVVRALGALVALTDQEKGCPFKAVSYHGEVRQDASGTLHWEMIVDV